MTDQELFDAFDLYQDSRGLATTTRNRRRMCLGGLGRFMAPHSVTTVAVRDIDQWLARLKAPATKLAYYRDVTAFFRWAHRRELVDVNPMLLTDPPRKRRHPADDPARCAGRTACRRDRCAIG